MSSRNIYGILGDILKIASIPEERVDKLPRVIAMDKALEQILRQVTRKTCEQAKKNIVLDRLLTTTNAKEARAHLRLDMYEHMRYLEGMRGVYAAIDTFFLEQTQEGVTPNFGYRMREEKSMLDRQIRELNSYLNEES